jgi:hypothetical protein
LAVVERPEARARLAFSDDDGVLTLDVPISSAPPFGLATFERSGPRTQVTLLGGDIHVGTMAHIDPVLGFGKPRSRPQESRRRLATSSAHAALTTRKPLAPPRYAMTMIWYAYSI